MAKINRRKEHSLPLPPRRMNQTLVKESGSRIIREQSASVTTERWRRGKSEGERRREENETFNRASSVDVGSTIIRIENRWWRGSHDVEEGARRRKRTLTERETTEKEGVRVEEFLGSSRPRYAGKSEIDWREAGPCRGVCAT